LSYLKPILQPLKGQCRSTYSLVDCEYKIKSGKPVLSFSIAIANIGNAPLYIILGDSKKRMERQLPLLGKEYTKIMEDMKKRMLVFLNNIRRLIILECQ